MKPLISPAEFSANVRRRFYQRAFRELRESMDSVFNYCEVVAHDGTLGTLFGPFVVSFHETIEADYLNRVMRRLSATLADAGWHTHVEDNAISACSIPFDRFVNPDSEAESESEDDEPTAPYDPANEFLRRLGVPLESDENELDNAESEGEDSDESEGEGEFVFEPEDDADSFFAESESEDSDESESEDSDESESEDSDESESEDSDESESEDSDESESEDSDESESPVSGDGDFTFDRSDVYSQARLSLEAFAELILERDPNIAVELSNPDDDSGEPYIDVLLPQGDIVQYTVDMRALEHAMRSGSTKATLMSEGIAFFSYKVALSKLFARIEQSE